MCNPNFIEDTRDEGIHSEIFAFGYWLNKSDVSAFTAIAFAGYGYQLI